MTKKEAKAIIDKWDSMPAGAEKNKFWDKVVPAANEYPELYNSGPRARKPDKPRKEGK